MMSTRVRRSVLLLVAVGSAYWSMGSSSADTPTPTPLASTAEPTVPTVPVVPTDTSTPAVVVTELPTIEEEQATPSPTSPPPATEAPIVTVTNAPVVRMEPPRRVRPLALPTPTATPVPLTPAPVQVQAPPVPIEAPLPSPAQLRLDARLRWGSRVPDSVRRWAFLIVPAARKYHLNPNLLAAVMTMESGGDPLAWNGASDARGLMQILHGPWDPRANVFRGARMLARFLAQFGDLSLALAAYNAGPNAVLAYGGIPPYRETRDYVIVVSYLFDLFNHHTLSQRRRAQYRSTLQDLQHFADQRKKVPVLARVAHVHVHFTVGCRNFSRSCGAQPVQPATLPLFATHDPFWPLGDAPDPLQKVDPWR